MGHPLAIPGDFTVRLHALRVLAGNRNKWPEVVDAIDPGSLRTPYDVLNAEEAAALREATRLRVPAAVMVPARRAGRQGLLPRRRLRADHGSDLRRRLLDAARLPRRDRPDVIRRGRRGRAPDDRRSRPRRRHPCPITTRSGPAYTSYILSQYVSGPARTITLQSLPRPGTHDSANDFAPAHADRRRRGQAGQDRHGGHQHEHDHLRRRRGPRIVNMIEIGDQVVSRTRCISPSQTHHRHQVPYDDDVFGGIPGGSALYGWDQFRNPDGTPKYPQRPPPLVGPVGNYNSAGSVTTGHFHDPTKVIVAQSVMDIDAFAVVRRLVPRRGEGGQAGPGTEPRRSLPDLVHRPCQLHQRRRRCRHADDQLPGRARPGTARPRGRGPSGRAASGRAATTRWWTTRSWCRRPLRNARASSRWST